jgi:hypothetical protein
MDLIKEKKLNIFVVFVPMYQQIVPMFSNQLMLFCNAHSNMHSRWSSTIG